MRTARFFRERRLTCPTRTEFDLVYRAWIYVMKSWLDLPRKTGLILVAEAERIFDFWLGKPVRSRSWQFKFPTRQELFPELYE